MPDRELPAIIGLIVFWSRLWYIIGNGAGWRRGWGDHKRITDEILSEHLPKNYDEDEDDDGSDADDTYAFP